jgi:hypothetical protein
MNRTDAATTLGIDASASPEEAKRAYQELFTEHQVRLTNAPTPALRSLYQARLLELEEARDAFLANSLSDADSDLPTDQPTIPAYRSNESSQRPASPPPPPVEPRASAEKQPPPPPKERKAAAEPRTEPLHDAQPVPQKKSSSKWIGIAIGAVVVLGALSQLPRLLGNQSDKATAVDTAAVVSPRANGADSLPKIRENITVARVEFGRGDYDAANGALKDADAFYSRINADASADTAVLHIKSQLDSLHSKVERACDALKKVAARHPGEPTCKSL